MPVLLPRPSSSTISRSQGDRRCEPRSQREDAQRRPATTLQESTNANDLTAGTFVFNGGAAQTIGGTQTQRFNNLTVAKSAGTATLAGQNETVGGNLGRVVRHARPVQRHAEPHTPRRGQHRHRERRRPEDRRHGHLPCQLLHPHHGPREHGRVQRSQPGRAECRLRAPDPEWDRHEDPGGRGNDGLRRPTNERDRSRGSGNSLAVAGNLHDRQRHIIQTQTSATRSAATSRQRDLHRGREHGLVQRPEPADDRRREPDDLQQPDDRQRGLARGE